jgi:CheY-like chemotaxis protein
MAEILVVDDSEASAEVMGQYLETAAGHHATLAYSGAEAERLIDSSRKFDVLMFDFRIADINGLQLSRWARSRGVTTPIVLCSAIDEQDLKDIAESMMRENLGPVAVFSKTTNPPSKILDLIAKLTNAELTRTYR